MIDCQLAFSMSAMEYREQNLEYLIDLVWFMPLTSSPGFLNEKDYNSQVTWSSIGDSLANNNKGLSKVFA